MCPFFFFLLDTRGHYELLLDGKEVRCKNISKMYSKKKSIHTCLIKHEGDQQTTVEFTCNSSKWFWLGAFQQKCVLAFRQLSSQNSKLLWVPEELHHFLQLILGLLHSLNVIKGDVLHLDRVHCWVQAWCGSESYCPEWLHYSSHSKHTHTQSFLKATKGASKPKIAKTFTNDSNVIFTLVAMTHRTQNYTEFRKTNHTCRSF